MRRGRPKHDDVLTPREWQVLELIRQGLTNQAIASQLGISVDTVKFHVSEILSKLGVSSRREAAQWPGQPRVPQRVMLPTGGLVSGRLLRIFGASVVGVGVLGLAALLVALVLMSSGARDERVTMPVNWTEAEVPATDLVESGRPFSAMTEGGEDMWRAFVVEAGQSPRLLLETRRFIYQPTWTGDGISFEYWTMDASGELARGFASYALNGQERYDETRNIRDFAVRASPDRSRYLINDLRGGLQSATVYVVEHGSGLKLDGLNALISSWSPDGRSFLVYTMPPSTPGPGSAPFQFTFYVLHPGARSALLVGTTNQPSMVWSPDSRYLAYGEPDALVVFDVRTGKSSRTDTGGRQAAEAPVWSDNSAYLTFAGTVYEASSGAPVTRPSEYVWHASLSPDGEWLVVSLSPLAQPPGERACPPTGSLANRTVLRNLRDGRETEVFGCADGLFKPIAWLDDSRLLMGGANCTHCDYAIEHQFAVVHVSQGRVQRLTNGLEAGASYAIAPDGKLLISGTSLRVYGVDGTLMRQVAAPAGFVVRDVAWAPDGSSFVYIVGPVSVGLV